MSCRKECVLPGFWVKKSVVSIMSFGLMCAVALKFLDLLPG
jgi:hypothetical protein